MERVLSVLWAIIQAKKLGRAKLRRLSRNIIVGYRDVSKQAVGIFLRWLSSEEHQASRLRSASFTASKLGGLGLRGTSGTVHSGVCSIAGFGQNWL